LLTSGRLSVTVATPRRSTLQRTVSFTRQSAFK
jgi:hypothetical protein